MIKSEAQTLSKLVNKDEHSIGLNKQAFNIKR